MILSYLLTLPNGEFRMCDGEAFHNSVKAKNEHIGITFETRRAQLQRFTQLPVKDWEMIDVITSERLPGDKDV